MNSQQHRFGINRRGRCDLTVHATAWFFILLAAFPIVVWANPQRQQDDSHSTSQIAETAAVKKIKLLLNKGTPGLEILTTAPVSPHISKLADAMHLVIDLPNTSMSVPNKIVPIKNRDLGELRLNRYDMTPPMVRIEIAFQRPLAYTWDSAGNHLAVTFHEISEKDPSEVTNASRAESPLPVSSSMDAPDLANVVPAERLDSGSSISADSETTVLRLKHTGDVYVCPRTTVSMVRSKDAPDLMLAMNRGGLETHLTLKDSAGEVVTPDLRILLRGPGDFHYAIRVDSGGNACVRALPGNASTAIIYEQMGDGEYELKHDGQFVFHDGKLVPDATASSESKNLPYTVLPVECGCPPPPRQTLVAINKSSAQIVAGNSSPVAPSSVENHSESDPPSGQNPPPSSGEVQIPKLPEALRNQPHPNLEAALTFTPALAASVQLPAISRQLSSPVPALPPASNPRRHKTVLGKFKSFFSRVFR
jgi:hypothetical protein